MLRRQEPPKFFQKTPRRNPTTNWRIRIKHTRLVSQASAILLQRHSKFWAQLVRRLNLSSKFTPALFHQILNKIKVHPKICLNFFNYAQKDLDFKPDIRAQCEVTRILFGSDLAKLGRPILNSIVQDYPPTKILPLLIQSRENAEIQKVSPLINRVVECYCSEHMYLQGLEAYKMARRYGVGLNVGTCNALLNLLCDQNELRLAWCYYASTIRYGVLGDQLTWSVIARILYKDGKFERICKILDLGICTADMFDLMIDGYSRRGDFASAFGFLNEMCCKGIEPDFSSYSSILDGACKYQDGEVIEGVMSLMVEKGFISDPFSEYDLIIQKLCGIGKTFAMDLFYNRANNKDIELQDATCVCMLRALLSEDGRVRDAIKLYNVMQEKNISVNESCYKEFVNVLCNEKPSDKVSSLLIEIVRGGFISESKGLPKYIRRQCAEGRWREAEELLDSVLNQGFLLDSISCGCLVRRYCHTGQVDKAIALHNKLEELKGVLDTPTYEVLLTALFRERRVQETIEVFDYMRSGKMLSSESFSVMIKGLCHEKELRKAMKLHDEMVELGLKPDVKAYRRLISGFG